MNLNLTPEEIEQYEFRMRCAGPDNKGILHLYHGTPSWEEVLKSGFNTEADRLTDVGDFGWGIYLTSNRARAQCHGKVLRVSIQTHNMAFIKNPYFLKNGKATKPDPSNRYAQIFYDIAFAEDGKKMLTVGGTEAERIAVAERIRDTFVYDNSIHGIVTQHTDDELEVVVFQSDQILEVKLDQAILRVVK